MNKSFLDTLYDIDDIGELHQYVVPSSFRDKLTERISGIFKEQQEELERQIFNQLARYVKDIRDYDIGDCIAEIANAAMRENYKYDYEISLISDFINDNEGCINEEQIECAITRALINLGYISNLEIEIQLRMYNEIQTMLENWKLELDEGCYYPLNESCYYPLNVAIDKMFENLNNLIKEKINEIA